MSRWFLALIVLIVVQSTVGSALAAEVAAVAVDAPSDLSSYRALQSLTLQALQDQGLETVDPASLQAPVGGDVPVAEAKEAGATRIYVLRLMPLDQAVLAVLEDLGADGKTTLHRSSAIIEDIREADRVLGRLARAVVKGESLQEGAELSTVTEHEGREFAKRPGEFLWGFDVRAGFGAADVPTIPGMFGAAFRFMYEIEHATFGLTIGGGGSNHGGLYETTIRANYLFSESDISFYLGGGFGISAMVVDGYDGEFGGHGMVSFGAELFRLHATRLVLGADVMLPMYTLQGDDVWDSTRNVSTRRPDAYIPVPMFTASVLF